MIGFFDSWFWWLQTMKYFHDLYPNYDYVFLADNKNCPFWEKTWEEIQKITFDALNWFFDNWAKMVIIACNTSAAYSIRKRQSLYPQKKTLSITIPWVEEVVSKSEKLWSVWIIATKATVTSQIYNDLYKRFWGPGKSDFSFVMAPDLVDMVESWANDSSRILLKIGEYLSRLPKDISTLILWCTHFSIYKKYFEKLFKWEIVDPSYYSAKKFSEYIERHPEIKNKLWQNWTVNFFTTWSTKKFNEVWWKIWWTKIDSQNILI